MRNGVAGIIAALEPNHKIGLRAVIIRHLALAFIAPLRAYDYYRFPVFFHDLSFVILERTAAGGEVIGSLMRFYRRVPLWRDLLQNDRVNYLI